MSEALSSVEIEDVLSSIRRLVSEDLRPAAAREASAPATAAKPLVLTPSLRVVPPMPQAVWGDEEDWVEEPLMALPPMDWSEPAAPDVAGSAAEPPAAPAAHRFTLSEPAHQPEAVQGPGEVQGTDVLILALRNRVTEAEPEPAEPAEEVAPWAQSAEETAVMVEAKEPDDLALPEEPEVTAWADQAAAEAIADLQDTVQASLFHDAPEVTYDEDLLRDLVRDLIREELAGGLGEKITRNVRKLVRAEIAQALAARDLE